LHLKLAEAYWHVGAKDPSIAQYDAALSLVRDNGDTAREGMICMGKGFALMGGGNYQDALGLLERARDIAADGGHAAQAGFVENMIRDARLQAAAQAAPQTEAAAPNAGDGAEDAAGVDNSDNAAGGGAAAGGTEAGGAAAAAPALDPARAAQTIAERITKDAFVASAIAHSPVVLAMKGSPDVPACGYSKKAVDALRLNDVAFDSFDVMDDAGMRGAFKRAGDWPSFPQLYVHGRLLGGWDILEELGSEPAEDEDEDADEGKAGKAQGEGGARGSADGEGNGEGNGDDKDNREGNEVEGGGEGNVDGKGEGKGEGDGKGEGEGEGKGEGGGGGGSRRSGYTGLRAAVRRALPREHWAAVFRAHQHDGECCGGHGDGDGDGGEGNAHSHAGGCHTSHSSPEAARAHRDKIEQQVLKVVSELTGVWIEDTEAVGAVAAACRAADASSAHSAVATVAVGAAPAASALGAAPPETEDADGGSAGSAAQRVVAALAKSLGALTLPGALLEQCETVRAVADYVVEHCPTQGDCGTCPSRATCDLHGDGDGGQDIEELCAAGEKGEKGKGKGGKGGKGGKCTRPKARKCAAKGSEVAGAVAGAGVGAGDAGKEAGVGAAGAADAASQAAAAPLPPVPPGGADAADLKCRLTAATEAEDFASMAALAQELKQLREREAA
jgi:glutaredoxin-related protein